MHTVLAGGFARMGKYVKFTEANEWEGEVWHFWLPITGNEEALKVLRRVLKEVGDGAYTLTSRPTSEDEVNILVRNAEIGYFATHQKLKGFLNLPATTVEEVIEYLTGTDDLLYKGGIRDLFATKSSRLTPSKSAQPLTEQTVISLPKKSPTTTYDLELVAANLPSASTYPAQVSWRQIRSIVLAFARLMQEKPKKAQQWRSNQGRVNLRCTNKYEVWSRLPKAPILQNDYEPVAIYGPGTTNAKVHAVRIATKFLEGSSLNPLGPGNPGVKFFINPEIPLKNKELWTALGHAVCQTWDQLTPSQQANWDHFAFDYAIGRPGAVAWKTSLKKAIVKVTVGDVPFVTAQLQKSN